MIREDLYKTLRVMLNGFRQATAEHHQPFADDFDTWVPFLGDSNAQAIRMPQAPSPFLPQDCTALLLYASEGWETRKHYYKHHSLTVQVIEGEIIETCSGKLLRKGDSLMIPKGEVHSYRSVEESSLLLVFRERLPSKLI